MVKYNRIKSKDCETCRHIHNYMSDKYGIALPTRLRFVATDGDLFLLKTYKQYLEWNLNIVSRVLELFESKEE